MTSRRHPRHRSRPRIAAIGAAREKPPGDRSWSVAPCVEGVAGKVQDGRGGSVPARPTASGPCPLPPLPPSESGSGRGPVVVLQRVTAISSPGCVTHFPRLRHSFPPVASLISPGCVTHFPRLRHSFPPVASTHFPRLRHSFPPVASLPSPGCHVRASGSHRLRPRGRSATRRGRPGWTPCGSGSPIREAVPNARQRSAVLPSVAGLPTRPRTPAGRDPPPSVRDTWRRRRSKIR